MYAKLFALSLLSASCISSAPAVAAETSSASLATFIAKVDPDAFPERPGEHRKTGVTVEPRVVRLITPGIDKFSIYNLIGPPHFGEGITRRWNYVLFFPSTPGSSERVRCRMEIRFERVPGKYNVVVSDVIWKDQACADLVASAG